MSSTSEKSEIPAVDEIIRLEEISVQEKTNSTTTTATTTADSEEQLKQEQGNQTTAENKDSTTTTAGLTTTTTTPGKKISIQEKYAALRKQHLALEEEKLAKVKNDPSRKLFINPDSPKVDWKDIAFKSPHSTSSSSLNTSQLTPSSQGQKVSTLQNKWKEVLNESKNYEQSRFDTRKQQTISQFRIAQDGIVKQRIGEWEKLFLQSAATVEQLEVFYRKAQQAMMAKIPKTIDASKSSDGGNDGGIMSSVPSQDTTVSIEFPQVAASSLDETEVDSNVAPVFPPKTPLSESNKQIEEEATLSLKPAPETTSTSEGTEFIEEFVINDTKIYNIKELDPTVSNYILKCFKMNKSINRIPLLCGVFGNEKQAKPPIDVFAAAIKTSDESIFIALTVIVRAEDEQNPLVYGIKKIVIMAKDENNKLIEKILNIIPMEGMELPFEVERERKMSITAANTASSTAGGEDALMTPMSNKSISQEKTDQDQANNAQGSQEPSPLSAEIEKVEEIVPIISPFQGYLDKLFQSAEGSDPLLESDLNDETNPTGNNDKKIPEEGKIPLEEKILNSLGVIERSSNNSLTDSIELLDDLRQTLRSENTVTEILSRPSSNREDGKKGAEEVGRGNGGGGGGEKEKKPVLPMIDTILTKLQQCSKWKNEINKESREVLELKLLVSLREIIETNDFTAAVPAAPVTPQPIAPASPNKRASALTSLVPPQATTPKPSPNPEMIARLSDIIERLKISLKHSNYHIVKAALQTIELLNNYYLLPSLDKIKDILVTLTSLQTDTTSTSSTVNRYLSKDIVHCVESLKNTINTISALHKTEEELRDEIIDFIVLQLKLHYGYEFRANRLNSSFDFGKLHTKPADKLRKGYENTKGEGMRNKVKSWLLDQFPSLDFLTTEKDYFLKKVILQWLLKECSSWKDTAKSISISEKALKEYAYELKAYYHLYQYHISRGFYHHLVNIRSKYNWDSQYIEKIVQSIFQDCLHTMDPSYLSLYYFKITTELMNLDPHQIHHPNTIVILKHALLDHYDNIDFETLLMIPLECLNDRSYHNHIYNHIYLQYHEYLTVSYQYLQYKFDQFQKLNTKHLSNHTHLEELIDHEFTNILVSKFFLFRYPILNEFQYLLLDRYPINSAASLVKDDSLPHPPEDGEDDDDYSGGAMHSNGWNVQLIQQIKNYLNILIGFGLLRYENNYFTHNYSEEQYRELVLSLIQRINEILYTAIDLSGGALAIPTVKQIIHEQYINYYIDNYYQSTESYSQSINANYIIESLFYVLKKEYLQIQEQVVDYWIIGPRYHPHLLLSTTSSSSQGESSTSNYSTSKKENKKTTKFIPKAEFPMLFFNYTPLYENPNRHLQTLLNDYLRLIKAFQDINEQLQPLQQQSEGEATEEIEKLKEEKVKQYHLIQKKLIVKKIELTKNIIKFVELTQTIQFLNNTNNTTNALPLLSPTSPAAGSAPPLVDIDSHYIFESIADDDRDEEGEEELTAHRKSSFSKTLSASQRKAIQQLKQSCSLLLLTNYHQQFFVISTDYVKASYQLINNHPVFQQYYRIFYFEFVDYIYFIHYHSSAISGISGKIGGSSSPISSPSAASHHQPVTLLIKRSLIEKINAEYNQHGNHNICTAFPIQSPLTSSSSSLPSSPNPSSSSTKNKKNSVTSLTTPNTETTAIVPWIPHYLEYFIQILTIELIFSQQQNLENMIEGTVALERNRPISMTMTSNMTMNIAGEGGGNAGGGGEGSVSGSNGLTTVELFAREQLQRLIGKVKNELWIEESMLKTCYLPQLVEWAAGSIARDKVIAGNYRIKQF